MANDGVFVVVGRPIAHSLSVLVHSILIRQRRTKATYQRRQLTARGLNSVIQRLATEVVGFNATSPTKEPLLLQFSNLNPQALLFGAGNVVRSWGWPFVGNTDSFGIATDIRFRLGVLGNKTIGLLGSGGTARSIAFGLLNQRPFAVRLVARDLRKISVVARSLGHLTSANHTKISCHRICLVNGLMVHLLVNTTPTDVALVRQSYVRTTYDARYFPRQHKTLNQMTDGQKMIDGVGMLVWQGYESARMWHGVRPTVRVAVEMIQGIILCS